MKPYVRRILFKSSIPVLVVAFMFVGFVQADWAEITNPYVKLSHETVRTNSGSTVTVTIQNIMDTAIEGKLRLLIKGAEPAPSNPDGIAGAEGQNPTPYYLISTGQEEFFEPLEISTVVIHFSGSDSPIFDMAVEVNSAYTTRTIFRKNVSKSRELYSGEAAVNFLPVYVEAQNSQGVKLCQGDLGLAPCKEVAATLDEDAAKELKPAKVKPLVIKYVQEIEGSDFDSVPEWEGNGSRKARDIYVAASYDDGATWKRTNLSHSAMKSSFTLENKVEYPGDSENPDMFVVGPYVLVTWVDKFCRSGNPWDIQEADDFYQIMGPQRSVDYMDPHGDDDPRPDLGQRPFSCVWAARGVINEDSKSEDFGTINWFQAEQISTGRRDANLNFTTGVQPICPSTDWKDCLKGTGGFAVSWQEDPKGLKTGKGRGPGTGMSGSGVNHKTDIWYSFISWENFANIDKKFVPSDGGINAVPVPDGDQVGYTEDEGFRPHPLYSMSPPVRITDNNVCKDSFPQDVYGHRHNPDITYCDYTYESGTTRQPEDWLDLPDNWVCPRCGLGKETFYYDIIKTKHLRPLYCAQFSGNPRIDRQEKYVDPDSIDYLDAFYTLNGEWVNADGNTQTGTVEYNNGNAFINGIRVFWTGEPLNGDTGASRANLSMVNWNKKSLAVLAYEETKGIGSGQDKVTTAPEQKSPLPVTILSKDADGNPLQWQGPFKNGDCVSCHYNNKVPRDRMAPIFNKETCDSKGGTWDPSMEAYWPYDPYPLKDGETPIPSFADTPTRCIKFLKDSKICPRDSTDPACNYYALPTHLPGWHRPTQDCISCHLQYGTKDLDGDGFSDRFADQCLDTPENAVIVRDGCSQEQLDFGDMLTEEDKKIRHGKDIYYHAFPFNSPDSINQGLRINLPNVNGEFENARRVRVVPQELIDSTDSGQVTLGLLYKQGYDGQGSPADAFMRIFRGGFNPENLDDEDLNLSGSTILAYKPVTLPYLDSSGSPTTEDTGTPNPDYDVDIRGHKTPKVDAYTWTGRELLGHQSGWKLDQNEDGEPDSDSNGYPLVIDNPYENVYSTRLSIRGEFIVAGFAHSPNWAAAKKAKDNYDFYVRVSEDGGKSWELPANVSQLKNHKETVSDCRIIQPPISIAEPWYTAPDPSIYGIFQNTQPQDFHHATSFLVGIGTSVNFPEPHSVEDVYEEEEIFLDVFYTRTKDRGNNFETVKKENPNYVDVEGTPGYLNQDGEPTSDPKTCYPDPDGLESEICVPNDPNPAFGEFVEVYDWLAKGDAVQGDVQIQCTPNGEMLYGIWEQELPIVEYDGKKHFQGTDVWFRKITYPDFDVLLTADLDGDGDVTTADAELLISLFGTTAKDIGFRREADYNGDNIIDKKDLLRWEKLRNDYIASESRLYD